MSFYTPRKQAGCFPITLTAEQPTLQQFHRALMDKGRGIDWSFDPSLYTQEQLKRAGREWGQRAIAEYQSTAQFGQLLHRLTLLGAPLDMIGAATRLATDECRHAELCARLAEVLGGARPEIGHKGLSLYDDEELAMACALSILTVCCFGETLSVPILRTLAIVATDPLAKRVATVIAGDEEYHSRFGWEAFAYFAQQMEAEQRDYIQGLLPTMFRQFEYTCHGSPKMLTTLAETELVFEEGERNLGTLPSEAYAGIFYATIEDTLFPRLEALHFDPERAWLQRFS